MRILELTENTKSDLLESLLKRSPNSYGEYEGRVNAIIDEVREKRDEAQKPFHQTKLPEILQEAQFHHPSEIGKRVSSYTVYIHAHSERFSL